MRKWIAILLSSMIVLLLAACGSTPGGSGRAEESTSEQRTEGDTQVTEQTVKSDKSVMYIKIGEHTLTVEMADNSSAKALLELLEDGNITVDAGDYGNFEKVGSLGARLPTNDEEITTEPGDVILYQGNQITLYYDSNTWNFTRLGKVEGFSQEELKQILGSGDVTMVLSLNH